MRLSSSMLVLLPVVAWGCGDAMPRSALATEAWHGGPGFEAVASVTFLPRDSFVVTAPRSMAIDRGNGDFLIAEPRFRHIVRFNREGTPVRLYSSRAVGEQIGHTSVVAALPSRVVVADMVKGRVHHLDARTAALIKSDVLPGSVGTGFSQPAPELWIGSHFRGATEASPQGVVLMSAEGGDRITLGLPREFFDLPGLKINSGVVVARRADDVIVGFSALEALLRIVPGQAVPDTLLVPVRARRGVRRGRLERHGGDTHELVNRASKLVLLDQTSAGEILLVHFDSEYLESGRLQTTVYVSVVSADLQRACVDGRVDAPSLQMPNPYFSADTLWIQTAHVEQGKPRYAATAYVIDTSACEWLPIEATSSIILP